MIANAFDNQFVISSGKTKIEISIHVRSSTLLSIGNRYAGYGFLNTAAVPERTLNEERGLFRGVLSRSIG